MTDGRHIWIIDDDDVIDLTTGAEPSARAMMAAVWADTGLA